MTRRGRWACVLLYMGMLFVASSIPNPPAPPGPLSDKTIHVLLYTGLGLVSSWAILDGVWPHASARRLAGVLVIVVLYGVFDEAHQSFVDGRTADAWDLVADAVGGTIGAAAAWAWGILTRRGNS